MCLINPQWVEAISVSAAAIFAAVTFFHQLEQEKVNLWKTLDSEFNYQLRSERARLAFAFLKNEPGIADCYTPIMVFFEKLGYLVVKRRIDTELAYDTFFDAFSAYLTVTRRYLQEENNEDSEVYRNVFRLEHEWGLARWIGSKEKITCFFTEENAIDPSSS